MALFCVKLTPNNDEVKEFVKETKIRLTSESMIKNPFKGCVNVLDGCMFVVDLTPLYPNLSVFGWFITASIILFKLPLLFLLAVIPFLFMGLTFSSFFMSLIFKLGLRKKGYKGKIERIEKDELIRFLVADK